MAAGYVVDDGVVATGGDRQGFSRALGEAQAKGRAGGAEGGGGGGGVFSRAWVEAQAMGRPVVAEDGGGAAETVRPGVTGWLAPQGDPAALAEALHSALSLSIERRAELARAAQEK